MEGMPSSASVRKCAHLPSAQSEGMTRGGAKELWEGKSLELGSDKSKQVTGGAVLRSYQASGSFLSVSCQSRVVSVPCAPALAE